MEKEAVNEADEQKKVGIVLKYLETGEYDYRDTPVFGCDPMCPPRSDWLLP